MRVQFLGARLAERLEHCICNAMKLCDILQPTGGDEKDRQRTVISIFFVQLIVQDNETVT